MNEVSPRSDVWALGIVTFELLCGIRPFNANNPMAMYAQLRKVEVSVNCEKVASAGVSECGVSFLGRALTKDVAARPSANEALDDPWPPT